MQFKHPEILYFLGLLIIPILVHLFQLQRFVKVPFTNVAFLQKLVLQTRKSSQLKKWLILASRLLLLTGLIVAFAQPYFSNHSIQKKKEFLIYLDNSLSLTAKGSKGDLLPIASQDIIENLDKEASYSLLTNDNFYKNISASRLRELLLTTKATGSVSSLKNTLLKVNDYSRNSGSQNIIISDFQNANLSDFDNITTTTSLTQLTPELRTNLRIDSVVVNTENSSAFKIDVFVHNEGNSKENIPISISGNNTLINKQTFAIDENVTKKVSFQVQKTEKFLGQVTLNANDTYSFDNTFRFVIDSSNKTNVLAIGTNTDFLKRIYTSSEFNFESSSLNSVNYNTIDKQQLIILNELKTIPNGLLNTLVKFSNNGGNIVIIPNSEIDLSSYNQLLKSTQLGSITQQKKDTLKITTINYEHPIFKGVFEKRVRNFQYPNTTSYFETTLSNASNLITFENNKGFIQQVSLPNSKIFWVASPLNSEVTNFTNSPLIVPTFYNIGLLSLQHPKLFYRIGKENSIEVSKQIGKDEILSINNGQTSFIPLQQAFQNKVKIITKEQPLVADFYTINHNDISIKNTAFNYVKEESNLSFFNINQLSETNNQIKVSTSLSDTLKKINNKSKVHWLWKWFLALAIVSLLLEILILKFFKS
ncbi:BatA domain-containing protein [uncultured Tenacibaculum sp.]|uniref:BatA domain-containing protein n=1 Tax=uncultured Tenacibaculum sp. TaxID=174713 RepID=UPI00261D1192|nr:BatA domain-containing protein [uncultured Tenacibaculum sp.]